MKTTTRISLGDKFDRLKVIARAPNRPGSRNSWWTCRCVCGKVKDIKSSRLISKGTRSCGCLHREQKQQQLFKHGQSNTPLYAVWHSLIQRCTDPNSKDYSRYGARGITVCERWRHDFPAFLQDMGQPPPGMTLDRKDNHGPYSPDNCKWATRSEQMRNQRSNRLLTVEGMTLPVVAWAERNGISRYIIRRRLAKGYSDQDAVSPHSFRGQR